jgi:hypothetical protein
VTGSETKALTQDRGYGNVLLGQGCRTPHWAGHTSMEQCWMINTRKQNKDKTVLQCHFLLHHESYLKSSGPDISEPNRLSYGTLLSVLPITSGIERNANVPKTE